MIKRGTRVAVFLFAGLVLPCFAQNQGAHLSLSLREGHAELSVRTASGVHALEYIADLEQTNAWQFLNYFNIAQSPTLTVDPTLTPAVSRRFYRVVRPAFPCSMVYIPAGSFLLGSPESEADRFEDEGPQTWVTISQGFLMGRYEVTQREYQKLTGSNPSFFTGDLERPVEQVSWYDAVSFCEGLTAQERQAGRIPANWAFRLPTEAEWEYACRAGTTNRFSFGDDSNYTGLAGYAWYLENESYQTERGGMKTANPWGLQDMYGNVWEWCQDWLGNYPGGSVTDPPGAAPGTARVRRGGSWASYGSYCRSAVRSALEPASGYWNLGFRIVLAPIGP